MNKTSVELHRIKDTTSFVSHMGIPFWQDSQSTLDALLDWAQLPENAGRKVYRHLVRADEENVRREDHTWTEGGHVYTHKCDYVTYLDIYWQ
jgi:hypothetical protein